MTRIKPAFFEFIFDLVLKNHPAADLSESERNNIFDGQNFKFNDHFSSFYCMHALHFSTKPVIISYAKRLI